MVGGELARATASRRRSGWTSRRDAARLQCRAHGPLAARRRRRRRSRGARERVRRPVRPARLGQRGDRRRRRGPRGAGRGDVQLDGRPLEPGKVDRALARGIGYVPEDRHARGFVPTLGVARTSAADARPALALGILSRHGRRRAAAPSRSASRSSPRTRAAGRRAERRQSAEGGRRPGAGGEAVAARRRRPDGRRRRRLEGGAARRHRRGAARRDGGAPRLGRPRRAAHLHARARRPAREHRSRVRRPPWDGRR